MSVIMTMWVQADPNALEKYAADNPGALKAIADVAVKHGLIAHRFYGSEGQILVVDEWPDRGSFEKFFEEAQPQIQPVMQAAGATAPPGTNFWRELKTGDEIGWEESRGR